MSHQAMPRQARWLLLLLGLAIACCSLAALAYAFWPLPDLSLQATLAPTLFAPP